MGEISVNKTLRSAACFAGAAIATTGSASAEEVVPVPTPPPVAPAAAAPAAAAPPPAPPHTVVAGDHLSSIAQARLGSAGRWVEIYTINQPTLSSPDQIEVGQVLQIPSTPVAVPASVLAGVAPARGPARKGAAAISRAPVRTSANTSRRARVGADLAGVRRCESGGNYSAVSASGKYRGAYQFDQRTWESVGGSGDPAAASPGEQDSRAQRLRSQRGSSPWGSCG